MLLVQVFKMGHGLESDLYFFLFIFLFYFSYLYSNLCYLLHLYINISSYFLIQTAHSSENCSS